MDNIDWVKEIKPKLLGFLENMSESDFSYFRYSWSGDLFKSNTHWGLGNLVFATKILYISGLLQNVSDTKKQNLANNISKFSNANGEIFDPIITKIGKKEKIKKIFGFTDNKRDEYHIQVKRAETRQSIAALYLLQQKPKKLFTKIPYTKKGINNYLSSLNWHYPWAAASHFSHLLFFYRMNVELHQYKFRETPDLIAYAICWVKKLQSKDDGTWYNGSNVPLKQKINGAMKILTGIYAANIFDFDYPKEIIDTALMGINDEEACSNFNIVYILYCANKLCPNYRKEEIHTFLLKRLDYYKKFYHADRGGFSFFTDKSNQIYYSKPITKGIHEPDIHATALFIWGIALIDNILGLNLNFRIPVN